MEEVNLEVARNVHWIVTEIDGVSVGIKCFPRVGSQTILKTFGRRQNMDQWLKCKHRAIVVRNPWDRVLSVYYGMFRNPKRNWRMEDRGYPAPSSLEDFVKFLVRTPTEELDIHTQSMHSQLHGHKAKKKELYLLQDFLDNLPYGLKQRLRWRKTLWVNKTDIPEKIDAISAELFEEWGAKWKEDLVLYGRAEKQTIQRDSESKPD